jgi:hypothetical protein
LFRQNSMIFFESQTNSREPTYKLFYMPYIWQTFLLYVFWFLLKKSLAKTDLFNIIDLRDSLLDSLVVILLPFSPASSMLSRDNTQSINSIKEYKILSRPIVLVYNKIATYFRILSFKAFPKFNSRSFLKWK